MTDTQKKPKGAGKSSFELIDPNILTETLPIKPGSVVLDLACGKGAYSIFLSEIVGEQGLVYAVDLWKEGLLLLEQEIENKKITNIMTIIPFIIICNVYFTRSRINNSNIIFLIYKS